MHRRRNQAGSLVEAICGFALLFPLLVLIVFVTIEASQAYVIGRYMNEGATMAARALAEEYHYNHNLPSDAATQQAIFSNIRIQNMISSNQQFQVSAQDWQTTNDPKYVTVHVTYIPGVGNPPNPPFPNPNILNLGSAFAITVSSTYRLLN